MSGTVASKTVRIVNPQGLHARPARLFAMKAAQYQADIEVVKDGEKADGKSILSLLTLAAEHGSELALRAEGADAERAVAELAALVEQGFPGAVEDRPDAPPPEPPQAADAEAR